jgi:ketosteroid isomerase-like protein
MQLTLLTLFLVLVAVVPGQGRDSEDRRLTSAAERGVTGLIERWISAYRRLDAKALAGFETAEMDRVDGSGLWCSTGGRVKSQEYWIEAFDLIDERKLPLDSTIERVRFLRPDVAIVQAKLRYPAGVRLAYGARIPPLFENHTYVVIKDHGVWLIAAHNIERQIASEERRSCEP